VVRRLQQAVSCVSTAVASYALEAPETYGVALRGQGPERRFVRLSDGSGLGLAAQYRVGTRAGGRGWAATLTAYRYDLWDRDGREILSYHWHPFARSPVTTPHLHLGVGVASWRPELATAHLPTGRVGLEDVLLLAIQGLGVPSLRDDWYTILAHNQES